MSRDLFFGVGKHYKLGSMSASGAKRGRTQKKSDVVVVSKAAMGRPKKTLADKNPTAADLMNTITGVINGAKSLGVGVSDTQLMNAITASVKKGDRTTAEYLHQYMVTKRAEREAILKEKRVELNELKKETKYTEAQNKFSNAMAELDKKAAIQMRGFLIASLKSLDYLNLTSEKMNPQLEIERLFCTTMDNMNDKESSALSSLPIGDTQPTNDFEGGDGEEYDVDESDEDEGKKKAGSDDDTQEY